MNKKSTKTNHKKRIKIIFASILFIAGLFFAYPVVKDSSYQSYNISTTSSISTPSIVNDSAVLGSNALQNLIVIIEKLIAFFKAFFGNPPNSIAKVAGNFAWPDKLADGKRYKSDATKKYQEAATNIWTKSGDDASEKSAMWSDCGAFVGVVMIWTSFDKNFPTSGSNAQLAYVTNSNKYTTQVLNSSSELSNIKRGDLIFMVDNNNSKHGHAMIAAANSGTSVYSASQGEQVPNTRGDMKYWAFSLYPSTSITIARLK